MTFSDLRSGGRGQQGRPGRTNAAAASTAQGPSLCGNVTRGAFAGGWALAVIASVLVARPSAVALVSAGR